MVGFHQFLDKILLYKIGESQGNGFSQGGINITLGCSMRIQENNPGISSFEYIYFTWIHSIV